MHGITTLVVIALFCLFCLSGPLEKEQAADWAKHRVAESIKAESIKRAKTDK